MADEQDKAQETEQPKQQKATGGVAVKKVEFTFIEDSHHTYAFVHNLGTRGVQVSARTPEGEALAVSTIVQDENIVICFNGQGSYSRFKEGTTLIAMG